MVVDLEMGDVFEYESKAGRLNWFDASMIASTVGGCLEVWDFDHTNVRTLVIHEEPVDKLDEPNGGLEDGARITTGNTESSSVTTLINTTVADFPALVSSNNRFMYYVVNTYDGLELMRERIRD